MLHDWTSENSFSELLKIILEFIEEWVQDDNNINHLFKTDVQGDSYESLLTLSAKVGASDAVIKLLDEGADINLRNSNRCTPLHCGSQYGHLGVVEILLDKGADVNVPIKQGCTPLYLAACEGHLEIVDLLVKNGANVDVSTNKGSTPLLEAVSNGHLEVVSCLIGYGCAIDKHNCDKTTPLLEACMGKTKIFEFLINAGGDMNAVNKFGRGLLHEAVLNNSLDIVKLLVDKGVDIDKKCEIDGLTALDYAIKRGHLGIVTFLIDEMKMELIADDCGRTPLSLACLSANLSLIKYFVEEKMLNCCVPDKNGFSPLHVVALNDNSTIDVIKYLVSNGADVNARDKHGASPLYYASVKGKLDFVRCFIEETCVNLEVRTIKGRTPFQAACASGNLDLVKYLVEEKNASLTNRDICDHSPLNVAVESGHFHIAKYFIEERGVEFNSLDIHGRSILEFAVHGGNLDMVRYLIKDKHLTKFLNFRSLGNLRTPLHEAALRGHKEVAEFLLDNGAILDPLDRHVDTPLKLAVCKGHFELVELLCNRGARLGRKHYNVISSGHGCETDLCIENKTFGRRNIGADDLNVWDKSALYSAVFNGEISEVKHLIEEESDNDLTFYSHVLGLSIKRGHLDITKYLIDEKNANVNFKDKNGKSVLHLAVQSGNIEMVKYLVDEKNLKQLINSRCEDRWTPLHEATSFKETIIVDYLLTKGAIVDSFDKRGNTCLHIAATEGYLEGVMLFLNRKKSKKESKVNAKNNDGLTPLRCAQGYNHVDIINFINQKTNS